MRVCLDTNVLVAAFATRGLCADVLRTVLAEHELVIGEFILNELRHILESKFKLPADRMAAVEGTLAPVPVAPTPSQPAAFPIRDASDRRVLATAVEGKAAVLVTGDRDLLDVRDDAPLPILDPREFWEFLRSNPLV